MKASEAAIAQLGERQTEDLEVPGSIPGFGIYFSVAALACLKFFYEPSAKSQQKFIFASGFLFLAIGNSNVAAARQLIRKLRDRELNPGHPRDRRIH